VAILIIFAIMLTSRLAGRDPIMTNEQTFIGAFLAFLLFGAIFFSLRQTFFRIADDKSAPASTLSLGRLLMTDFALPFELVSVLLLAAMIGAIVIARAEGE
jgi:NADH-quinone oxidoreductase subunit J